MDSVDLKSQIVHGVEEASTIIYKSLAVSNREMPMTIFFYHTIITNSKTTSFSNAATQVQTRYYFYLL